VIKIPTIGEWMQGISDTPINIDNLPSDAVIFEDTSETVRKVMAGEVAPVWKAPLSARRIMEAYWGERCPDYEPECPACKAWEHFDRTNEVME